MTDLLNVQILLSCSLTVTLIKQRMHLMSLALLNLVIFLNFIYCIDMCTYSFLKPFLRIWTTLSMYGLTVVTIYGKKKYDVSL